jgi:hypothetical protein
MKKDGFFSAIFACVFLAFGCQGLEAPQANGSMVLGRLSTGDEVVALRTAEEDWGLATKGPSLASVEQPKPIQIEFSTQPPGAVGIGAGYRSVVKTAEGFRGTAAVTQLGGPTFNVEDNWKISGAVLSLARRVTVSGNGEGGFLSAITLATQKPFSRSDVDFFVPGMIYGGPDHLTEIAIGGMETYRSGQGRVRIREDRMPAPVLGVRFKDGSSLAVLDFAPQGATTAQDSHDVEVATLVDERFRFGAVGAEPVHGRLQCGFWFPGTEGEMTYRGDTYPRGQLRKWRGRYHPLKDGLTQNYQVNFRFSRGEEFPAFYEGVWRWAWSTLKPAVIYQDIAQVRRSLVDLLASHVDTKDGRTALPVAFDPMTGEVKTRLAEMGFGAKNLEAANFLLQDADNDPTPRGETDRRLGAAIIDTFTRLKMSPPEGTGFNIDTGEPWPAPDGKARSRVFLRSFSDDLKSTLKAYKREKKLGRDHPEWLRWCQEFGDWLLTQQRQDGGFPRAWKPRTGEVLDASPESSYNPIPMLVLLTDLTGQRKYMDAAVRAAEFCWKSGQAAGTFVGGTIDNPNVVDKEAGTLSVEAYLALYEATHNKKWLDRAVIAANFSETWIYIWNVPMPEDENAAKLHWKPGVSTVGLQLIASGHSLVDDYMAFDTDQYAKLYVYTKESHYLDVSRLLLHNTKLMIALPGRLYDLAGPGWQQEHWSLAPRRGIGLNRRWYPWVATSQLKGILGLEEFDPRLFEQLASAK